MRGRLLLMLTSILSLVLASAASAGGAGAALDIALSASDVGTLHLEGRIGRGIERRFLLDTGSAYVVLTDDTRRALDAEGSLIPVRTLRAVMANNATAHAPVYRVSALRLGNGCVVRNFEAVVLPGARKDILGLSVLRAVAPFTVDVEPLRLRASCPLDVNDTTVAAWSGADGAH